MMFFILKCLKESFEILKKNIFLILILIGAAFAIIIVGALIIKFSKDPINLKFDEFIRLNTFSINIIFFILSQIITIIYFPVFIKLAKGEQISFPNLLSKMFFLKILKLFGLTFFLLTIYSIYCLFIYGITLIFIGIGLPLLGPLAHDLCPGMFGSLVCIFLLGLTLIIIFDSIPFLIFISKYLFSYFSIVDGNLGIFESLKESSDITKGSRLKLFFIFLFSFILNLIPFIDIFTSVFSMLFYCVIYKELCIIHGIMEDNNNE